MFLIHILERISNEYKFLISIHTVQQSLLIFRPVTRFLFNSNNQILEIATNLYTINEVQLLLFDKKSDPLIVPVFAYYFNVVHQLLSVILRVDVKSLRQALELLHAIDLLIWIHLASWISTKS